VYKRQILVGWSKNARESRVQHWKRLHQHKFSIKIKNNLKLK